MRLVAALLMVLVLAPAVARAESGPAKIRLQGGSSIFGVVTELAPGSYVIVLLAHGELRTIPWSEVELVHVRGSSPIGPGAPPPSSATWLEKTGAAALPPDVPAESSAPPAPGRWALGARGTVLTPTTARMSLGLGLGGELDLVHWFTPELALYGLCEHTRFNHSREARTTMFGGGLRVSSSAGTSALLDVSTGFRVLSIEGDSRGWLRRGAVPLRLGAGIRLRSAGRFELDLLLHVAPHVVPYISPAPSCGEACAGRSPSPLGFIGVSLGFGVGL